MMRIQSNLLQFGQHISGVGDCPEINQAPGKVVLISGPSGVGKGTVIKALWERQFVQDNFTQIRSLKSRPPRPSELANKCESDFVTDEEFVQLKEQNKLFQYAFIDNHWYGSKIEEVLTRLKSGLNPIFELAAQDALRIKEKYPDKVVTIFLRPEAPEIETLRARLVGRGTNDEASIAERLKNAIDELALKPRFDHVVESATGKVKESVDDIIKILQEMVAKLKQPNAA